MNYENIRIRYIELGIPLFLVGIIIFAVGVIFEFLAEEVYESLSPVAFFLISLGALMIGIFSPSFLFVGCGKE